MKQTHRPLTVAALICATFLAAMEATAVATVMPTVVGDLGGIHLYAWVFTAYMLASTVMVPIFGKLADTFGRKHVLQAGIVVFLIGSLGAGMATSMSQLIFARVIQGLGAGAIQPIGITIIGDIYEVKERAQITSIFSAVWAAAGIAGPLLGAFIASFFSWPWIFYLNIPMGLAALALLQVSLHEQVKRGKVYLDVKGAIFLSLAVSSLLVGVNQPSLSSWLLPLALIFVLGLWITERTTHDPLFPPALFSKQTMASASAISGLFGATLLAIITYIPLYVQGVLQESGTKAAAAIIPMALAWPLASTIAARLIGKFDFRFLIITGLSLMSVATLIIALAVEHHFPVYVCIAGMTILGLGLGCSNLPLIIAVQSSVNWNQRGVATSSLLFFRAIGGTVSVGFLGSILANTLLTNKTVPIESINHLLGSERGANLPLDLVRELSSLLDTGLEKIFWLIFVICLLAFTAGLSFPLGGVRKNS